MLYSIVSGEEREDIALQDWAKEECLPLSNDGDALAVPFDRLDREDQIIAIMNLCDEVGADIVQEAIDSMG